MRVARCPQSPHAPRLNMCAMQTPWRTVPLPGAQGDLVASYRKVHLFDVDVPNGPVLMESRTTAPGDQVLLLCGVHVPLACAAARPGSGQVPTLAWCARLCPRVRLCSSWWWTARPAGWR